MFDVAGSLDPERSVERLNAAESRGVSAAMPAVLVTKGPVEQVRMSLVAGAVKDPTPGKLKTPPETVPVTTPKLDCVSIFSGVEAYFDQTEAMYGSK